MSEPVLLPGEQASTLPGDWELGQVSGVEGAAGGALPVGTLKPGPKGGMLKQGNPTPGNKSNTGRKEGIKAEWLDILEESQETLRKVARGEAVVPKDTLRALELVARHVLGTEVSTVDSPALIRAYAVAMAEESIDPDIAERITDRVLKLACVKGS